MDALLNDQPQAAAAGAQSFQTQAGLSDALSLLCFPGPKLCQETRMRIEHCRATATVLDEEPDFKFQLTGLGLYIEKLKYRCLLTLGLCDQLQTKPAA